MFSPQAVAFTHLSNWAALASPRTRALVLTQPSRDEVKGTAVRRALGNSSIGWTPILLREGHRFDCDREIRVFFFCPIGYTCNGPATLPLPNCTHRVVGVYPGLGFRFHGVNIVHPVRTPLLFSTQYAAERTFCNQLGTLRHIIVVCKKTTV